LLDISYSFLYYDHKPEPSQQAKIAKDRKDFWTTLYKFGVNISWIEVVEGEEAHHCPLFY
jgi:hypothetical protein